MAQNKKTSTGHRGSSKKKSAAAAVGTKGMCDGMSFTYAETMKMIRTKLNMIIPNELADTAEKSENAGKHRCKLIGITSSLQGEGKSTTAANLAYTFAQTGSRVCLIDADMRIPMQHKNLKLKLTPGLSNLLTGQCKIIETLQKYTSPDGVSFWLIAGGDTPPMPAELLDSTNMQKVISAISGTFDYVIVDLPPITVVTDALIASKYLDGILLVVRRNYCDKASLRDTVEQFRVAGVKTLGMILTRSNGASGGGGYYRKNRYASNYSKYGQD